MKIYFGGDVVPTTLNANLFIDGWKAFVKTVENNYRNLIENAFKDDATDDDKEMFPHYFDCEAHVDVLRELYPSWHKKN